MSLDNRGNAIARFRVRVGIVLVLRECLRLFFLWIMLWAAVVVLLRVLFQLDQFVLLWGALGLVLAVIAATVLAIRKMPCPATIRALLDRHGGLGGLLMAAGDVDIGRWHHQIAEVPIPAVRWRSGRQCVMLMASIGFLTAALVAPDRYLPANDETVLQIGGEMQKLTDKIQVLKQEQILPPEKAQVLEKDLDLIRQEASGNDPAKSMEAIDHLQQSFNKAAAEAAQSAIKQTETASRMEELAAALDMAAGRMDPRQLGAAMKQLAHMAEEAVAENQSLAEGLSDELLEALQKGVLTDEQLRELCQTLGECKASQRARLMELIEAELIDADKLILCDEAGQCDAEALLAALCECEDSQQLAECLACGGLPGRGGITRGRGDALMTWQPGVETQDAAFKQKVLPPAAVASLQHSRLAGISAGNPTSAKPSGGSTGDALRGARAGSGEARAQIILPEHKQAVQRYFKREKK